MRNVSLSRVQIWIFVSRPCSAGRGVPLHPLVCPVPRRGGPVKAGRRPPRSGAQRPLLAGSGVVPAGDRGGSPGRPAAAARLPQRRAGAAPRERKRPEARPGAPPGPEQPDQQRQRPLRGGPPPGTRGPAEGGPNQPPTRRDKADPPGRGRRRRPAARSAEGRRGPQPPEAGP